MDGLVFVRISVCVSLDNVFCGTFCAGYFRWKDSNSGRTGLDLGLVCSMRRGLQPEVCCVVLYYSLLALPRRAVEVRIVIYLSVLEGWRMNSRLMVTTLGKAIFGCGLIYFRVNRFGRNAVLLRVVVCAGGEVFVLSGMEDINLVDPASSHTLVSKIKPCMSKYKQFCTVKLRMAHYISYSLIDSTLLLG